MAKPDVHLWENFKNLKFPTSPLNFAFIVLRNHKTQVIKNTLKRNCRLTRIHNFLFCKTLKRRRIKGKSVNKIFYCRTRYKICLWRIFFYDVFTEISGGAEDCDFHHEKSITFVNIMIKKILFLINMTMDDQRFFFS